MSNSDLNNAKGIMRTLRGVVELGNDVADCYSAGVMSQRRQLRSCISCSLFAFTIVLKGCELAEPMMAEGARSVWMRCIIALDLPRPIPSARKISKTKEMGHPLFARLTLLAN